MKHSTSVSFLRQGGLPEKVVILGGGIAGLSLYTCLKRFNIHVEIYEAKPVNARSGLGFLLLENGVETVCNLNLRSEFDEFSNYLSFYEEHDVDCSLPSLASLDNVYAMRRDDLISLLKSKVPDYHIHYNKKFTSFLKDDDGRVSAAVFEDGTKVEADLFIGADGIHSRIRSEIFPQAKLERTDEHEIVCMVKGGARYLELGKGFYKFICPEKGFNMGMFELGEEDAIWFVQLDVRNAVLANKLEQGADVLTRHLMNDVPESFKDIIQLSDLGSLFHWKTKRMDLLPRFHKENIVLIGDAAHPLLPFTSQGVNSALKDACILSTFLQDQTLNMEDRLDLFYEKRKVEIQRYISEGDELLAKFLNAKKQGIPLVC